MSTLGLWLQSIRDAINRQDGTLKHRWRVCCPLSQQQPPGDPTPPTPVCAGQALRRALRLDGSDAALRARQIAASRSVKVPASELQDKVFPEWVDVMQTYLQV